MNNAPAAVDEFRTFASKINMSMAIFDVLIERHRQRAEEGFSHVHDDTHEGFELSQAAACYALHASDTLSPPEVKAMWPWNRCWWKPKTPREDLVRAAALILAEIERIDRLVDTAKTIAPV